MFTKEESHLFATGLIELRCLSVIVFLVALVLLHSPSHTQRQVSKSPFPSPFPGNSEGGARVEAD